MNTVVETGLVYLPIIAHATKDGLVRIVQLVNNFFDEVLHFL